MDMNFTIPVNEAFEASAADHSCGCALCALSRKLEENELDLILGASMMEPDIRIRTNERGFCRQHYDMMFVRKNRLGMALTLESHLDELSREIKEAIEQTPTSFPTSATVACQGTEGAYSFAAAKKLFAEPTIRQYPTFSDVFAAIERGECRYGVLPIENSTAGSVTEIYDLMARHRFYIVRATRLAVDHCLLAKPGTRREEITEVVSHKQALAQCAAYLESLPSAKQTPMTNTALAAEHVAKSKAPIAAIASRECAALFGLAVLDEHIADAKNNRTRFICISKTPEIYKSADKTSIICTLPHVPGSLARTLARFDAMQINLTKLESRPIPERDFEFRFYFDLVAPPNTPTLLSLLSELAGEHEEFRYLGTYTEL